MIGDTSKHTTREKRRIGSVINRPIEVLPYEKGDNKDLTLTFKARNFNDRELTVKPDEYIDNVPFGLCTNLTGRGWETIITNAEQNAIDGGFTLTKTQCFRNCTSLTDYDQIHATWK